MASAAGTVGGGDGEPAGASANAYRRCPFCAIPEPYDVYLYPNDFPAFEGGCDVVLYSPEHTKLPSQLSVEQWEKVVALWTRRTAELQADPKVKHIMIFENAGDAVGVTMPHPHGQIYAFPFVPPRIERGRWRRSRSQKGACTARFLKKSGTMNRA